MQIDFGEGPHPSEFECQCEGLDHTFTFILEDGKHVLICDDCDRLWDDGSGELLSVTLELNVKLTSFVEHYYCGEVDVHFVAEPVESTDAEG